MIRTFALVLLTFWLMTLAYCSGARTAEPMPFVGEWCGGNGQYWKTENCSRDILLITPKGISEEDYFCRAVTVTKKFDRTIPVATQTPLGAWVYMVNLECKHVDPLPGQKPSTRTMEMYFSKGELHVTQK